VKQIEKAGSTISQTLAGLILDIKGKKKTEPSEKRLLGDDPSSALASILKLLVIYLIINIIQFVGTLVLWRDGTHLQTHPRHGSVSSTSYQPVALEDTEAQPLPPAASSSNPRASRRTGESAVLSSSDDEEAIVNPLPRQSDSARLAGGLRNDGSWAHRTKPLLLNPNISHTDYTSLSSRLASPVRTRGHPTLARSAAQRRRGKVNMLIFFGTIVFTWIIFMSTAIIKMNGPPKP
jgi:hypothetical protein